MKTLFTSPEGAIKLSMIALLSLLARSYADTRYILIEDYGHLGRGFVLFWILVFTAIVGGWFWALVAAAGGSRRAWVPLLVYALMTGLGAGVASLFLFASEPTEVILFSASLVIGLASSVSIAIQLQNIKTDG